MTVPTAPAGLLVGVAALALVAGCAASGGGSAAGSGSSAPAPSLSASPSPSPSSPSGAQPPGVTTSRPITLIGTVRTGAEPACLIQHATRGEYELQGRLASRLRPEQQVRVTGHTVHGVMSHCMQGTPFVVTSIGSP